IAGSIAWARANHHGGILTSSEVSAIETGVDEDIQTANERRWGEIIGMRLVGILGGSRNEQIAVDKRLWSRMN
ncbi:MAG: argininosuccinate lyase, partial [Pleopsidium flavum]